MTDAPETPLLTQAQLRVLLRIEVERARRYRVPLSCLLLRIDRGDELADAHGEPFLRGARTRLVQLVRDETRVCDAVALHDGRVSVVLPHTDGEGVTLLGERLRRRVQETSFSGEHGAVPLSVSIGVSSMGERSARPPDLLRSARAALDLAESHGGDQLSGPPESSSGDPR